MAGAGLRLTRPLLLIGCGKMGGAMLSGWLERGIAGGGVAVVDPLGAPGFAGADNVTIYETMDALPGDLDPEVVIFAVKPQQMDAAAPAAARFAGAGTVFLSIAAGKRIAYFQNHLGRDAAIVRAMPNTPAAIGQGITVACRSAKVTDEGMMALAGCKRLRKLTLYGLKQVSPEGIARLRKARPDLEIEVK